MSRPILNGLSFRSATVHYGDHAALQLNAHSFTAGQVTALLGANGSGKSSLLKSLIGVGPGQLSGLQFGDADARSLSRLERARRLAFLSQDRTGPGLATVESVLSLGRHPYRGMDTGGRMAEVTKRLDLEALLSRRFGTLSGGQQARVLLGRALVVDAPVLLADEPTASLDAHYALRIMAALRDEARTGRTVIVSCHDLPLARRFCDRALVLKDGRGVAEGPIDEALSAETLANAFALSEGPDGFTPIDPA